MNQTTTLREALVRCQSALFIHLTQSGVSPEDAREYHELVLAKAALEGQHPDDAAVDAFAAEMKSKLAKAREKGRSGWQTCPPDELSRMLREHVEKGDPRDVANFCMFLWSLGQGIASAPKQEDESGCLACVTCGQPAQAAQSAGEVERRDVVAFEFYNRATGHAIVDYSVNTHVGKLSADKGYEARPLVYADKREDVTDGSKPIPLWQAREALDELEAAARGDAPFNHQAAAVVRAALASQQAGKGEPVHPNHRPDLRYILTTLERVTPVVKHQKELREQVQASITGMRYVIERTEAASPPSREPLTAEALGIAMTNSYYDAASFIAGVRFAERHHGIHSREGGSNG